ncbi:MAG: ATP synthase F1 subunit delta [Myxococcota bacterium]|jgi:F-type H+-transporting ATPase subunit delta
MAIRRSLAKRYSKALVASAKNDAELDTIMGDLKNLARTIDSNTELKEALLSPVVLAASKASLMKQLGPMMGLSPLVQRFVDLLISAHRIDYIDAITETFSEDLDAKRGLLRGELFSTVPMSEGSFALVQGALSKTMGKKVMLAQKTDSGLLGGIQVRVGGMIIDGSLRSRLDSMLETMKSA